MDAAHCRPEYYWDGNFAMCVPCTRECGNQNDLSRCKEKCPEVWKNITTTQAPTHPSVTNLTTISPHGPQGKAIFGFIANQSWYRPVTGGVVPTVILAVIALVIGIVYWKSPRARRFIGEIMDVFRRCGSETPVTLREDPSDQSEKDSSKIPSPAVRVEGETNPLLDLASQTSNVALSVLDDIKSLPETFASPHHNRRNMASKGISVQYRHMPQSFSNPSMASSMNNLNLAHQHTLDPDSVEVHRSRGSIYPVQEQGSASPDLTPNHPGFQRQISAPVTPTQPPSLRPGPSHWIPDTGAQGTTFGCTELEHNFLLNIQQDGQCKFAIK